MKIQRIKIHINQINTSHVCVPECVRALVCAFVSVCVCVCVCSSNPLDYLYIISHFSNYVLFSFEQRCIIPVSKSVAK